MQLRGYLNWSSLSALFLLFLALAVLVTAPAAYSQSTYTYRDSAGPLSSTGIKQPVKVATTAAITLSGGQTIDGIAVNTGDRVLVKNQSDTTTNGIYNVQMTAWTRAADCDGPGDVVSGTIIAVDGGIQAGLWQLTTADPVVIGTSNLTFATVTLSATTATNATNIGTTVSSTNASYYITGVATATSGNQATVINSGIFFNPSTGTVSATKFSGTNAALTGTTTTANLVVTGTCTGCSGTASLSLSGLTAATTGNAIDNTSFAQTWAWQALGAGNGLTLTTTNGTSGGLLVLAETTTGAGKALSSTLTGASNTGYAGYFVNPATTGYAGYFAGAAAVTGVFTASGNAALTGTTSVTALNTSNASLGGTTTANNLTVKGTCTGCGSGALIPLNTVNASAAAQVSFGSTYITSTYNKYVLEFDSVYTSAGTSLAMKVSSNNGGAWLGGSDYCWVGTKSNPSITAANQVNGGGGCVDAFAISQGVSTANSADQAAHGRIVFSRPSAVAALLATWDMNAALATGGAGFATHGDGQYDPATPVAINAIEILPASGTITGHFTLFGIVN